MKTLYTEDNGGFPAFLNDLRFMETTHKEAFEYLLKPFSSIHDVFILSGCNRSITTGTVTITEGWVVINGEICRFQEQSYPEPTGSDVEYWSTSVQDLPDGLKQFQDGNSYETWKETFAVIQVDDTPTLSEYADTLRYFEIIQRLNGFVEIKLNIGAWNMQFNATKEVLFPADIDALQFISVEAYIVNNDEDIVHPLHQANGIDNVSSGHIQLQKVSGKWKAILTRLSAGAFSTPSYNDAVMNRGWLILRYLP